MTLDPESDARLVARFARDKDPLAFERLLERHWGEAHRLAARLVSPGAADDVAQQAFLDLVEHAGRLEPGRPFGPWFRTLVLNRARNQARAAGRRRGHEVRASRPERVEAPADLLDARALADRVADLPDEVRVPLVLHYWEGLSHAEVAETLGCPKGTAASRIRRGLEQLQGALAAAGCAAPLELLEARLGRAAPAASPTSAPPARRLLRPRAPGLAALASAVLVVVALGGVAAQALTPATPPSVGPDAHALTPPAQVAALETAVAPDQASVPTSAPPAPAPVTAAQPPAPEVAPALPPATEAAARPGPSGEVTLLLLDDLGQPLPAGLRVQLMGVRLDPDGTPVMQLDEVTPEVVTDVAGVVRLRLVADSDHAIMLRAARDSTDADAWGGRFWSGFVSTAPAELLRVGDGQALALTRVVPRRALVTLRLTDLPPGADLSVHLAGGALYPAAHVVSEGVLLRLAPGARTIGVKCRDRAELTLKLDLAPGQELVVERRLDPLTARLTGVVVDDEGRAVVGATIASGASTATTRADGSFELEVAAGGQTVAVQAPGHCRRTIRWAATAPLRVELERAAILELCVTGPAGSADRGQDGSQVLPLGDLWLQGTPTPTLADLDTAWTIVTTDAAWTATWSQERGRVERHELPAGQYRLRGAGGEGVSVSLRRGEVTRVDLDPGK